MLKADEAEELILNVDGGHVNSKEPNYTENYPKFKSAK